MLSKITLMGDESSTNELPLTAVKFPLSPEIQITDSSGRLLKRRMSQSYNNILEMIKLSEISPLATNERPLSCTCSIDQLFYENCLDNRFNLSTCTIASELDFSVDEDRQNWKNSNLFKQNFREPLMSMSLDSFDRILSMEDHIQHDNFQKSNIHNKTGSYLYDINNNAKNRNYITNTITQSLLDPQNATQTAASSSLNPMPFPVEYLIPTIQSNTWKLRGSRRRLRKTKSTDDNGDYDDDDDARVGYIDKTDTVNNRQSFSFATPNFSVYNKPHYPIIKVTKKSHLNKQTDSTASHIRRHRHSLGGNQMSSCFKMFGVGGKNKMTTSQQIFSTAVISGSSSAPNLRDMIPHTASPSGNLYF
jgi:hypothetical protein